MIRLFGANIDDIRRYRTASNREGSSQLFRALSADKCPRNAPGQRVRFGIRDRAQPQSACRSRIVCSFYPTARGPIANRPFGTLRRKSFTAKKSGPISGATLKRQGREGKSGKAMLTSP